MLVWLLIACNPASHQLNVASAYTEAGDYAAAITTYDDVVARWSGSEEAIEAWAASTDARIARAADLYAGGAYQDAGEAVLDVVQRTNAGEATDRARRASGEGLVSAYRYVAIRVDHDADGSLTALLDGVIEASGTPEALQAEAADWACSSYESFPEYARCAAPDTPPGDLTRACADLLRLSRHCAPTVSTRLSELVQSRRPADQSADAEVAGLLGALASGPRVHRGAPDDVPVGAGGFGVRPATQFGSGRLGQPRARRQTASAARVAGPLAGELVDGVVRRHMDQLRYCYLRELPRQPALAGALTVTFKVDPDATVSNIATGDDTLDSSTVTACLVGQFVRMTFPESTDGVTEVAIDFRFDPPT